MSTITPFPSQSSVLSDVALRDWLATNYDLPEIAECRLVSSSLNDVYQVVAGDERAYLRVCRHGWRTRAEVDGEVAIVLGLVASDLPVSAPIPHRSRDYVTCLNASEGTRFAALWTEAPGDDVRDITPEQAARYGRIAAEIHGVADRCARILPRGELDAAHLIDEPLAAIQGALAGGDDLAELERVAVAVRSRLEALPREAPDYGLCHGDLHPGNVRFGEDGPTLFDFDCCGYGWRGYDLAVFLWNIYGERRPRRWRASRWRAFQRGYAAVRPLPAGLDEQLPYFLIARQIWLTGLDFAGKSGYPPQWVGPGLLRTTLALVKGWREEFALSI